jgi:hypothetical protein
MKDPRFGFDQVRRVLAEADEGGEEPLRLQQLPRLGREPLDPAAVGKRTIAGREVVIAGDARDAADLEALHREDDVARLSMADELEELIRRLRHHVGETWILGGHRSAELRFPFLRILEAREIAEVTPAHRHEAARQHAREFALVVDRGADAPVRVRSAIALPERGAEIDEAHAQLAGGAGEDARVLVTPAARDREELERLVLLVVRAVEELEELREKQARAERAPAQWHRRARARPDCRRRPPSIARYRRSGRCRT